MTPQAPPGPEVIGQWSGPWDYPSMLGANPHFHELAHAELLPTGTYAGKVLLWRNHTEAISPVWIFDRTSPQNLTELPGPQTPLDPCLGSNLFCSGHVKMEDGSVLIGGGTDIPVSPTGLASSWLFLPDGTWQFLGCMEKARYYPTVVRFGDNRAMAIGGWETSALFHKNYEVYDPALSSWVLASEYALSPVPPFCGTNFGPFMLYPWTHLLASGRFYVSGELRCCTMIDTTMSPPYFERSPSGGGLRNDGCSLRMPSFLSPAPGNEDNVVILGGGGFPPPAGTTAFNTIEACADPDAALGMDAWQTLPLTLLHPRKYGNAVILPDRTVFLVGGSERVYDDGHLWVLGHGGANCMTGVPVNEYPKPVLEPELLWQNPITGLWASAAMASHATAWLYHTVAILLPSGQVLVAGGQQVDWADLALCDPTLQNVRSRDAAIWDPPYLFKGPRPQIHQVPAAPISYVGPPFNVDYRLGSPDDPIARAVITRPGSVTHHFDAEHRYVELTASLGPSPMTVTAPPNSNHAPKGYWMMWLVSATGIPSEAAFVRFQ